MYGKACLVRFRPSVVAEDAGEERLGQWLDHATRGQVALSAEPQEALQELRQVGAVVDAPTLCLRSQ